MFSPKLQQSIVDMSIPLQDSLLVAVSVAFDFTVVSSLLVRLCLGSICAVYVLYFCWGLLSGHLLKWEAVLNYCSWSNRSEIIKTCIHAPKRLGLVAALLIQNAHSCAVTLREPAFPKKQQRGIFLALTSSQLRWQSGWFSKWNWNNVSGVICGIDEWIELMLCVNVAHLYLTVGPSVSCFFSAFFLDCPPPLTRSEVTEVGGEQKARGKK